MNANDYYVIWSIEHGQWWRPNEMGYTPSPTEAGVYDRADTDRILARANRVTVNECAIPLPSVGGPLIVREARERGIQRTAALHQ